MNINMHIEKPDEFRHNLRKKLQLIVKKEKISVNLEKAIFNYCILKAKKKKIVRKWDNKYFVQIYADKLRSIFNNINPKYNSVNKKL